MHKAQTAEPRDNAWKNEDERKLKRSPEVEKYRKELAAAVTQEVWDAELKKETEGLPLPSIMRMRWCGLAASDD